MYIPVAAMKMGGEFWTSMGLLMTKESTKVAPVSIVSKTPSLKLALCVDRVSRHE
jgi:hypothetical protein